MKNKDNWNISSLQFLQHAKVLYMLWRIHPSVRLSVHLSVTLRYCVKMREHRRIGSSPSGSPVSLLSSFLMPRKLDGEDPVQVKYECKEVNHLWKQLSCTHLASYSRTVVDGEKSSINTNRKLTMDFPTSHRPRPCITFTFPKMSFRYPNL